jgi:lipoprotein-anchoring transpeptidase ErfK/SrfK
LTDYHVILLQAVAALDPNTASARGALYDRARRMQIDRLHGERPPLSQSTIDAERATLEAAIDRVEAEIAHRQSPTARASQGRRLPSRPAPGINGHDESILKRFSKLPGPARLSVLGAVIVLFIGIGGYAYLTGQSASGSRTQASLGNSPGGNREAPQAGRSILDVEELAPGVDGGSTDAGLPYPYRRQPVYYRTVYSVGMLIIDRSQRFLYLVQPQITALRYGIGVGGECTDTLGLYRISRKVEWPEWEPSPELLKRGPYPSRVAGGPGNPLGARVLYLDSNRGEIHGTNAPKTIGHPVSLGCFRMVNDDIVDLYSRVPAAAAVVVTN